MKLAKTVATLMAGTLTLTACASLPDTKLNYYLPTSDVKLGAIMTVACEVKTNAEDPTKKDFKIIRAVTPTISVRSYADYKKAETLDLSELSGPFSSSNIALEWYDDGRLKGINAVQTGSGKEILEAASGLFQFSPGSSFRGSVPPSKVCEKIKAANKDTETVSFQYQRQGTVNSKHIASVSAKPVELHPTKDLAMIKDLGFDPTKPLYGKLSYESFSNTLIDREIEEKVTTANRAARAAIKKAEDEKTEEAKAAASEAIRAAIEANEKATEVGDGIPIYIRKSTRLKLELLDSEASNGFPAQAVQTVAGVGKSAVYIPKAQMFGSTEFSLALNENGSIAKIGYGKTNGAAQAFGAINTLGSALQGPSTADQLAAIKTEADIILENERLLCIQSGRRDC